jgi:ribosome-associated protein YbcJ (S4-like RNA binding protein)
VRRGRKLYRGDVVGAFGDEYLVADNKQT